MTRADEVNERRTRAVVEDEERRGSLWRALVPPWRVRDAILGAPFIYIILDLTTHPFFFFFPQDRTDPIGLDLVCKFQRRNVVICRP